MLWIAPTEKDTDNAALEERLLDTGSKCEVRSPSCEVQSVRQSKFVIRHSPIPATVDYDAFGRIYEYFLGEFARTEGQKGGEFYTPSCIVRLLTEVIEPYHGRILDPACGSGGMFVQSARFVAEHRTVRPPSTPALLPRGEGSSQYRGGFDFSGLKERARELRRATPPPKVEPGKPVPPPTNPPPALERKVWEKKVSQRPLPKGAEQLVPKLKQVFAAQGVPTELIWLAEVESSFDRRAKSPAGAAGLFQLMLATAQRFGLNRWPFDQRYQIEPSAQAAAQYLKALHKRFRDWPLAVAAYNAGEGRVGKLLTKHNARSFDTIASCLPAETQMYVPKVEATVSRREGTKLNKLPVPKLS